MRVVALFRVSTERQADEGASLAAQRRAYDEMAAKNGWTTVERFTGCESASGAATDRRVLQQVLACIRETEPDAVYVHEQSRLTRGDELEVALLMRELKERRVKVIVNGVVRDLASIDERFMVGIQSLVDRAESERIRERLGRGKRERARQGKKNSGKPPYGYRNPPPGAPGRGTLQVVPEQAAVVRKIFDLAVGGMGGLRIAKALNGLGIPAPRGGKWGKATIQRVLCCPAYIGTSAANVWITPKGTRARRLELNNERAIVVPDAHEAIIERATWDALRASAPLPKTATPRLLSGMLYINGLKAQGDFNRRIPFYRTTKGTGGRAWLASDKVEAAVWDSFVSLATSPEFVERLMQEAAGPREQAVLVQEIDYLEQQVGKHQRRLERLVDMRADGEIDKAAYHAKTDEARAAIQRMEAELAGLRAKAVVLDGSHATRVVKAVQTLLAGRVRLDQGQRRSVLRSIVRRIDVAAVATGLAIRKGDRGRFQGGEGSKKWHIKSVLFSLLLPAGESIGGVREVVRDGELATTPSDCGQPSGTESINVGGDRAGQLGTTYS